MTFVPPFRERYDKGWRYTVDHTGHESNPQVTVSARHDKVLYSPSGRELIRIEDRPVGFRSGIRRSEP